MTFGKRLKQLRVGRGLTQEQAADSIGVLRPAYTKYESDTHQPTFEKIIMLSEMFNVSIDFLVKGDGSRPIITFGKRLSTLRKGLGLSQSEVANTLLINKSSLAMYETDKREPNFETLIVFADFFNVTTDFLLGRTDEHGTSIT